jgi:hypothetical protein
MTTPSSSTFSSRIAHFWHITWLDNRMFYAILGFGAGLLFYPLLKLLFLEIDNLMDNLVPEAIGIIFTIGCIDVLNRRRDNARQLGETQERLIREASGQSSELAKSALHELEKRGWLRGTQHLPRYVKPAEGDTFGALIGQDMRYANLTGADLWSANLTGTILRHARLQDAILRKVNLSGADLRGTYLENAILREAIIDEKTLFDERTVLPDGARWHPAVDLTRFTQEAHPEFWCSTCDVEVLNRSTSD